MLGPVLDASNARYMRLGSRLEEIGDRGLLRGSACKSWTMSQGWRLDLRLKFQGLWFTAVLVRGIVWLTC